MREALILLQEQGFVRRVANTGTFVTEFTAHEVGHLYSLRVEWEVLALQWARARVTETDLTELKELVDSVVKAGEGGDRREFLERDYVFHRRYWELSGNPWLAEALDRLMAPLFAFVVLASGAPLTASMAREHYALIDALRTLEEPEFTTTVRKILTGFASRWLTAMDESEKAGRIRA